VKFNDWCAQQHPDRRLKRSVRAASGRRSSGPKPSGAAHRNIRTAIERELERREAQKRKPERHR
jgi:hypothetical protein